MMKSDLDYDTKLPLYPRYVHTYTLELRPQDNCNERLWWYGGEVGHGYGWYCILSYPIPCLRDGSRTLGEELKYRGKST